MTTQPEIRKTHPYHMYDAIFDQPDAIARVLKEESDAVEGLAQRLATDEIGAVKAMGWHAAALVGQGDTEVSPLVDTTIQLPETVEPLTPLIYFVPLQIFTYWLALEVGRNPDLFRQDEADHRVARAKYQL